MKTSKFFLCAASVALISSMVTPTFASNDLGPLYDANGARNARYDHDAKPIIKLPPTNSHDSKTTKTITGGTVTSNVWVGNRESDGHYEYQVSTNYDKTDHTNIKATWWGKVTGSNVSFSIGTGGISIGSSTDTKETEQRYWENTHSQQDASYRADGYLDGSWTSAKVYNRGRVWGDKTGEQGAEVTARADL